MKIGMLTQWYDPEPGPAAIPGIIARELVAQGHEVHVLTGFPNYPTGTIYPGYRQRIRSRSVEDGVIVTRVPLHPSHDRRSLGRILNYLSFAASATLFGAGALRGMDGVWVYNSPITVSLPLLVATRGGRIPIFLQVQDLWPESLVESGMMPGGMLGRLVTATVTWLVNLVEARSTVVGVSSPGARDVISARHPTLPSTVIVDTPNPADESLFYPVARSEQRSSPFTVMYAGAIGEVQGLDAVVDAATVLREEAGIRFVLVGDGIARKRLQAESERRRLENVEFAGRVRASDMRDRMTDADVHLVMLADRPFLRSTTPSKISALLASEVPMIAGLAGDGAELIDSARSGFVVPPGDGVALADAVRRMSVADLSGMAASGREYYETHLSATVVASRIVRELQQRHSVG